MLPSLSSRACGMVIVSSYGSLPKIRTFTAGTRYFSRSLWIRSTPRSTSLAVSASPLLLHFRPPSSQSVSLFAVARATSSRTISSSSNVGGSEDGEAYITEDMGSIVSTTIEPTLANRHDIRISKLLSQFGQNLGPISRREIERMIKAGRVTMAGKVITKPHQLVNLYDVVVGNTGYGPLPTTTTTVLSSLIKVGGKTVQLTVPTKIIKKNDNDGSGAKNIRTSSISSDPALKTRIWIAHKLTGELVADSDPHCRPSLMERLVRGGVGKSKKGGGQHMHLKPIGRLDMPTEGLILVTNDGNYARQMELPANQFHRTYRVRAHGVVSEYKLACIEKGMTIEGVRYSPMKVDVDDGDNDVKCRQQRRRRTAGATNKWLKVTCSEGKNRQIRKIFHHLGLTITRLIRVSYGDYQLMTIPPGMAIEVPAKPIEQQKRRGPLFPDRLTAKGTTKSHRHDNRKAKDVGVVDDDDDRASPVQWVRHI